MGKIVCCFVGVLVLKKGFLGDKAEKGTSGKGMGEFMFGYVG